MRNVINKEIFVVIYYFICRISLSYWTGLNLFSIGVVFDFVIIYVLLSLINKTKRERMKNVWYTVVLTCLMALTIGNIEYFKYFKILLSVICTHEIKALNTRNTADYALHLPEGSLILIILFIVTIVFVWYFKKTMKTSKYAKYLFLALILTNISLGLIYTSTSEEELDYYTSDAYLYRSEYDRVISAEKWGYLNYLITDIFRFPIVDFESEKQSVDSYFENNEEHVDNDYTGMLEGYNVITILSETLDTRFISADLTPNLYQLKTEGMVFSNYYTTVFQNGATCNSEFMSLTGLNAVNMDQKSVNACDAYNENYYPNSLPNQLGSLGYETYYFHGQPSDLYQRDVTIANYGFDHQYFYKDILEVYPDYKRKQDSEMIHFYDEYVDSNQLFYINFLSYSMHGAYDQEEFDIYREQVIDAYPNETNEEYINYLEKLVSFDVFIGSLLDRLEEDGVLDNTVIAIYPDHYPYMLNTKEYLEYHNVDNYELRHQDFIIYSKGITSTVIDTVGSTEDVAPTILNLVTKTGDYSMFLGMDLLSLEDNFVLFHDMTITDGKRTINLLDSDEWEKDENKDLKIAILKEIHKFETSRKILRTDYFKKD